jgi:hypothetical protein
VGSHRVGADHVADLVQVSGDARRPVGAVRGTVKAQDLDVEFVVTLLTSVRAAFANGMDRALQVSAGIALIGAVLTMLFLPKSNVSLESSQTGANDENESIGNDKEMPVSPRERKKAKTRSAIQALAPRPFQEQGYDATTVQQIIEEAEVSESTFFRYFPTKSDVVLMDDLDPLIVEALQRQPEELSVLQALR